jgi:hypothetical protein
MLHIVYITVNASNFGVHENFGLYFAEGLDAIITHLTEKWEE